MKEKKYLSKSERHDVFIYGAACAEIERIAKTYKEQGWTDWAKWLKCAATNINKVLNERMLMLDEDALKATMRQFKQVDIVIKMKESKLFNETEPGEEVLIKKQDYETLVEHALLHNCVGCLKDPILCELKSILVKTSVPVWDDTVKNMCPYSLECDLSD